MKLINATHEFSSAESEETGLYCSVGLTPECTVCAGNVCPRLPTNVVAATPLDITAEETHMNQISLIDLIP